MPTAPLSNAHAFALSTGPRKKGHIVSPMDSKVPRERAVRAEWDTTRYSHLGPGCYNLNTDTLRDSSGVNMGGVSNRWSKTGIGLQTEGDVNPSLAPGIYMTVSKLLSGQSAAMGDCERVTQVHDGIVDKHLPPCRADVLDKTPELLSAAWLTKGVKLPTGDRFPESRDILREQELGPTTYDTRGPVCKVPGPSMGPAEHGAAANRFAKTGVDLQSEVARNDRLDPGCYHKTQSWERPSVKWEPDGAAAVRELAISEDVHPDKSMKTCLSNLPVSCVDTLAEDHRAWLSKRTLRMSNNKTTRPEPLYNLSIPRSGGVITSCSPSAPEVGNCEFSTTRENGEKTAIGDPEAEQQAPDEGVCEDTEASAADRAAAEESHKFNTNQNPLTMSRHWSTPHNRFYYKDTQTGKTSWSKPHNATILTTPTTTTTRRRPKKAAARTVRASEALLGGFQSLRPSAASAGPSRSQPHSVTRATAYCATFNSSLRSHSASAPRRTPNNGTSKFVKRLSSATTAASRSRQLEDTEAQMMGPEELALAYKVPSTFTVQPCTVKMNGTDDRFARTGFMSVTEDQVNPWIAPGAYEKPTKSFRAPPKKGSKPSSQDLLNQIATRRKDNERKTYWRQACKWTELNIK